jgi:hypothetical protein
MSNFGVEQSPACAKRPAGSGRACENYRKAKAAFLYIFGATDAVSASFPDHLMKKGIPVAF